MGQQMKADIGIINQYLLRSIWPIIKGVLTEPFLKGIRGEDFFSREMLLSLVQRINAITPKSQRRWGTMQPDQMLHHLNLATGSGLGYFNLPDESYLLSKTVFKWLMVDLLSRQPRGLQLPLNFKIASTERFNFEAEKRLLLEIVTNACNSRSVTKWLPHPYFGTMTRNEWGRLLTMHIDYHLKQFKV
jgi:hypothetical protein